MKIARVAHGGQIFHATPEDKTGAWLRLSDGRHVRGEDLVWLPPTEPGTIVALGLNYSDHAHELSFKAPDKPLVFLKGPNALLGHRGVTRMPDGARQMHYECELAVVIGKPARRIQRQHAYDHVAGYTVANDYVVREYIENYYRPNLRAKSRDGCTIVGPWMIEAADLPNPMDLTLRTRVNGTVTQEGSTKDMIFDVPFLIEYLSAFMTLSPGDLILTGTPHGVVYLKPGDRVETEIVGIGRLENTLVGNADFYSPRPGGATT